MKRLLALPLRRTGGEAVSVFNRPRLFNLYGLLCRPIQIAQAGVPGSRTPPFVEILWMPAYAVRLSTLLRGKPGDVWVTVDGCGGHVQVLEDTSHFALRDIEEESFAPSIEEKEAAELGRKGLLHYTLRQRRLFKPIVQGVEEVTGYWYPVWVYYFPRRFGTRIDFKVLEANTGRLGGARLRIAVINALIAERNRGKTNIAASPES